MHVYASEVGGCYDSVLCQVQSVDVYISCIEIHTSGQYLPERNTTLGDVSYTSTYST